MGRSVARVKVNQSIKSINQLIIVGGHPFERHGAHATRSSTITAPCTGVEPINSWGQYHRIASTIQAGVKMSQPSAVPKPSNLYPRPTLCVLLSFFGKKNMTSSLDEPSPAVGKAIKWRGERGPLARDNLASIPASLNNGRS